MSQATASFSQVDMKGQAQVKWTITLVAWNFRQTSTIPNDTKNQYGLFYSCYTTDRSIDRIGRGLYGKIRFSREGKVLECIYHTCFSIRFIFCCCKIGGI